MGFPHAYGTWNSSLMNLHILKGSFTINKAMSSLVSMKSYKFVDSIVWDVKLRAFSFTLVGFKNFYAQTKCINNE
jgi:hypothetical protein